MTKVLLVSEEKIILLKFAWLVVFFLCLSVNLKSTNKVWIEI